MIELKSPQDTKGSSSRWVDVAGKQIEVFTLNGVEYVRGEPADVVVIVTQLDDYRIPLRRRDSVARANALCSIHKSYRAIRKPRTNCAQCWRAYEERH